MEVSLSAQNIVKRYGGVVALSDGNLEVKSGEVVALVGANGSGKSTLSKIITGVVAPNQGQLLLDGQQVSFSSPQAAKKVGVTAVYQELSLIPGMTVAENIWLGNEPMRFGFQANRKAMIARTQDLLDLFAGTFQSSLIPDAPVSHLPPDERQIVEILKALSKEPRLIILDEATARLDSRQVKRLFELVTEWKTRGTAIVFVSHRMDEIFRVADRVTVLRNGDTVGNMPVGETDEQSIVELMIEQVAPTRTKAKPATAPAESKEHDVLPEPVSSPEANIRLEVHNLSAGRLGNVDLQLRDGELLGIAGLQGQGQADLLMAIFGAIPSTGEMILSGNPVRFRHPVQAMRHDVALVPGDRASEGLLLIRSILENFHLPSWGNYGFPLNMNAARHDANKSVEELSLVMESLDAPVSSLSGGNAQKVVIGKWLLRKPKLLLLNDPTKGVDVGAKGEFYALLEQLRDEGTAILFYSSDDEELLGLCNRVLVLHDGSIAAELSGDTLTRLNLVSASMGTVQGNNHETN
jgi:ribose transport system ATP-binding protein